MKSIKINLRILLFLAAQVSWGGVFTFYLDGYPKLERNCHQQTPAMAELFEKGTGAKVLHIECVRERQTGYDFSLEYDASEKLEFTSTDYGMSASIGSTGRFRDKSQCEASLLNQTNLFREATGLTPFLSFCRSQELEAGKNWEVILMAVGKSEVQPRFGVYLFFPPPQQITLEEISEGLRKALQKKGAILADLILHYNTVMGTGEGGIHYFSRNRIEFTMDRLSQVPSLEQCQQQLLEAKTFLQSESDSLFTLYCGGPSFGFYDLHFGIADKPRFSWQKSVDGFASLSECENQKGAVLKHYAGSPTHPLLGGLCSRDYQTQKYNVVIFKQSR